VSGRNIYLLSPELSEIDIRDIAHALAYQCRFNGHVEKFYSVAQHSVYVSQLLSKKYALHGLLHDATEAYLGDVIRPLKPLIKNYDKIEGAFYKLIAKKFNFNNSAAAHEVVKWADDLMLVTEIRDLRPRTVLRRKWADSKPADFKIRPWGPNYAKRQFLRRFRELTNGRKTQ
jgi:hypothetical protein